MVRAKQETLVTNRIDLARAYVQAHDELESQKHQADLADLRQMDDARLALAARIQEREDAYVDAQNALFAHDIACGIEPEPTPESVEAESLKAEFAGAEIFDEAHTDAA